MAQPEGGKAEGRVRRRAVTVAVLAIAGLAIATLVALLAWPPGRPATAGEWQIQAALLLVGVGIIVLARRARKKN